MQFKLFLVRSWFLVGANYIEERLGGGVENQCNYAPRRSESEGISVASSALNARTMPVPVCLPSLTPFSPSGCPFAFGTVAGLTLA